MKYGPVLLALLCLSLAGCSTAPGTGWSRAPDLSVWSAMNLFGNAAREQSFLCSGFDPVSVERRWAEDFAGREQWVRDALVARHGADAVDAAEAQAAATRTIECGNAMDSKWRRHHGRLLRLLESRLGST